MSAPGELIADRYRLVTKLGSGGMGVVWEAWDERLERRVAVKQLHPHRGLSETDSELARNRAMREARINARLHHRHAVAVFDVVEHAGQPCLVMQYIPAVPLSELLRDGGPLQPAEAAQVGGQVGSALAAAHQAGIVHRDVKPGNILIADDGSALISDFGISHALGDATLTETGMVHGTPAYLAPEVARGGEANAASDVFSLGATLYAALEGAPPFGTDQNSIALLHRVATGDFDPPVRSGVLTPVLLDMLSGDPAARPSMAAVVRRLTGSATEGQPPPPALSGPDEGDVPTAVARTVPFAVAPATAALTPVAMPPARPTDAPVSPPPVGPGPATPMPVPPPARHRRSWALTALVVLVGAAVIAVALTLIWPPPGSTTADPPPRTSQPPASSPANEASPTGESSPTAEASPTAVATPTAEATTTGDPTPSPAVSTTPTPKPSATPTTPRPSSVSPSSAAPSSSPTSTPVNARPTAAELAGAIDNYYALMPGGTDQAWSRMTSSYQTGTAGGRRSYERFWGAVRQVTATDISGTPPDRATATITYVARNGEVARERTAFRLVRDDGVLKINSSTVL